MLSTPGSTGLAESPGPGGRKFQVQTGRLHHRLISTPGLTVSVTSQANCRVNGLNDDTAHSARSCLLPLVGTIELRRFLGSFVSLNAKVTDSVQ